MSNPPLTREEIARKFGISADDVFFATAEALSRSRPDRTICELPDILCPHCAQGFTACYVDVAGGTEMPCEECGRIIYIEHIEEPDVTEDEKHDGSDHAVTITLCTHPPEGNEST